ncbi:hypothetical protein OHV05_35200 (plasmid) [Kitasatospora sp. NBC_00070]|uniref:hypothetical protein n=1 Tax=Kitasatospora sp. NBC_00070 TaxID=2975962 RepID=UPI002F9081D9
MGINLWRTTGSATQTPAAGTPGCDAETSTGSGHRRTKRTLAAGMTAALAAAAFTGLTATGAHAASAEQIIPCQRAGETATITDGNVTCSITYSASDNADTWNPPALISSPTSVTIEAYGADGGAGAIQTSGDPVKFAGAGGRGGYQKATFLMNPSVRLTVKAGGAAYSEGVSQGAEVLAPGRSSFNGGSGAAGNNDSTRAGKYYALWNLTTPDGARVNHFGGGGGGGSFVGLKDSSFSNNMGSVILAAGGGGGMTVDNSGDPHAGYDGGTGGNWHGGSPTNTGAGWTASTAAPAAIGGGGSGWSGGRIGDSGNGGAGGSNGAGSATGVTLQNAVSVNGADRTDQNTRDGSIKISYTSPEPGKTWNPSPVAGGTTLASGDSVEIVDTKLTNGGTSIQYSTVRKLTMQGDGNLVTYDRAGQATWATNTEGNPGAKAVFGTDGNLYIKKADGTVLKRTYSGQTGSVLTFTPAGELKITNNGATLWSTSTNGGPLYNNLPNYVESGWDNLGTTSNPLTANTEYSAGIGANARTLKMQGDGNLVLKDGTGQQIWASNTWDNPNAKAVMDNGQFKILNAAGTTVWHAANTTNTGGRLQITSDGLLRTVNSAGGNAKWSTGFTITTGTSQVALESGQVVAGVNRQTSMQGDGNLVTYDNAFNVIFTTNTWGNNGAAAYLTNGSLEIHSIWNGPTLWTSNSFTTTPSLTFAGDGNIIIRNTTNNSVTWDSY